MLHEYHRRIEVWVCVCVCCCICMDLQVHARQCAWWRIYRTCEFSVSFQRKGLTVTALQLLKTIRSHVGLALALANDKSISYSSTDICFVWEEKPLKPISSTHSIQSESLCILAVWTNPVFSLPAVGGKRREKHHLFLLFIFAHPGGSALKQRSAQFIHLYVLLKTLLCYKFTLWPGSILRRCAWRCAQSWNAVTCWYEELKKIYTCSVYSVWNMKMNLLCRW